MSPLDDSKGVDPCKGFSSANAIHGGTTSMSEHVRSSISILRRKQVEARTGLSRSSIYKMMSDGSFPKPVSLGARAVGWVESHVDQWLESRTVKA
jgi:prophage regulatory protein